MRNPPFRHQHAPNRATPEPDRSFELLRLALARQDHAESTRLFESLNSTHWVPRRADLVPWLRRQLGDHASALLVDAFATLPCHFCGGQWDVCPTCKGRGENQRGQTCKTCEGLALGCCAACNGAGLVNYAAIPVGLRAAVLRKRVAAAAKALRALRTKGGGKRSTPSGARVQQAIALRATLANAVRAASERSPHFLRFRDAIPRATRKRVLRLVRDLVIDANVALRVAIAELAEIEGRSVAGNGTRAEVSSRRADRLLRLAGRSAFVSPLLYRKALGRL